jgi:hypothetical protein
MYVGHAITGSVTIAKDRNKWPTQTTFSMPRLNGKRTQTNPLTGSRLHSTAHRGDSMEQHHVITFLDVKDLKRNEIATKLSNTYNRDADDPPSIKYCLHQIKLGRTDLQTQHVGGRPLLEDIDAESVMVL